MRLAFVVLTLFFLTGCPGFGSEEPGGTNNTEIPENPEWETHVLPIMDRLCNECHSVPATQSAPGTLRLDTCEETDGIPGAQTFAARIVARQINTPAAPMPPADYKQQPTGADNQIVQNWVDNGAPCEGTGVNNVNNTNNATNNTNNATNNTNNATNNTNNATNNMNTPTFTQVADILRNNCTDAGCHTDPMTGGNFEMDMNWTNAQVETELGGTTMNPPADTAFIVPNNAANSAIFQRITDADPMTRMPLNDVALGAGDVSIIGDWIDAGADYSN